MRENKPNRFLSKPEEQRIVEAIREAERGSSGEIRVHLVRSVRGDLLTAGKRLFEKLGMTKTQERNGVLFLVELQGRRLAILGDQGIHAKVPENFWVEVRDLILAAFREERFVEGLAAGILRCGERLKEFFPSRPEDRNELPNQVTYS